MMYTIENKIVQMKRVKFMLSATLVFSFLVSCNKRLDDFLFNGDNTITEYLLDNYPGPTSLDLPGSFFVPEALIHKFNYTIQSEGETLSISAIYVGDIESISEDTVVLYSHGNRDHMDFYWPRQKVYAHMGGLGNFGVLMFDYPGYGLSEGISTEQNMYDAVEGALLWLKEKGLTDERLVMYGFSLGSAPTCKVAAGGFSMMPNKIILEAPFASSEVMVQDAALLALPASFLVNVKIDNAEQVKLTSAPLLWIHGDADDFLAMDTHGEVVYKNHNGLFKEAIRVPGGGHETVPTFMGIHEYSESILAFIRKDNE